MTTESKSSIRKISKEDGVTIAKSANQRPILIVKKTRFDIKVRLHKKHKAVQKFYDFITDFGMDLEEKQREFSLTGWIILPEHFLDILKGSNEFEIRMQPNERLLMLQGA